MAHIRLLKLKLLHIHLLILVSRLKNILWFHKLNYSKVLGSKRSSLENESGPEIAIYTWGELRPIKGVELISFLPNQPHSKSLSRGHFFYYDKGWKWQKISICKCEAKNVIWSVVYTADFYPMKTTGTRNCGVPSGKICIINGKGL